MSGIVISYRRDDAEGSAGRLYDRLAARFGSTFVFMDYYSIESGEAWKQTIDDAVSGANVVLVLIGPRWSDATDEAGRRRLDDEHDYVRHEIRSALERGVPVLPVLVQGAGMTRSDALPADIAALTGVQNTTLDTRFYDRDVEKLYRLIDDIVAFGGELPRFEEHATAVAGFVGLAAQGPVDEPTRLTSWSQFRRTFGDVEPGLFLAHAVHGFFENGGGECHVVRVGDREGATPEEFAGDRGDRTGLTALETLAVSIVAMPDVVGLYERGVYGRDEVRHAQAALVAYAEARRWIALLDPLPGLGPQDVYEWVREGGPESSVAALYYPWLRVSDAGGHGSASVPPSGHIAGTWARNDAERGVWAAPANLPLRAALDVERQVTDEERYTLGQVGVNVVSASARGGIRAMGACTLSSMPQHRELATMRTVQAVGAYVRERTSWASFERSEPKTWRRVQSGVDAALDTLWKQGAFVGAKAAEAFYVRADAEVNPPELAARGAIRVEFGFALSVPGQFVGMYVEQPTGDIGLFLD